MGNMPGKICQNNSQLFDVPLIDKNMQQSLPKSTDNEMKRTGVRVKYSVTKTEFGRGAYGVVRKCINRKTKHAFAIKTINKSKVRNLENLRMEVSNMKKLCHPNIAKLVDVYEDDKYLHLITPLYTGGDLYDHIMKKTRSKIGKFSEAEAANLAFQMLDAIAYLHSHGIVHRDLKPENFVLESDGPDAKLKLIDFGLSAHFDSSDPTCFMESRVGTPFYIAPEVLCRKYRNKCDVWSIGVVLYILLCGFPPFYGDDGKQIFSSVMAAKVNFPSFAWKKVSSEAKDLICALLHKDQGQRPSAEQALAHPWFQKSTGRRHLYTFAHAEFIRERFSQYIKMNKFQKLALNYIVQQLSAKDIHHLELFFEDLDVNGDGMISLEDLRLALLDEGLKADYESIALGADTLLEGIDLNGDHLIDYREFLAAVVDRNLCLGEDTLHIAFEHFDRRNSGHLSANDLAEIFGKAEEAQNVINTFDIDGNGLLEFDEFKQMMRSDLTQ